MDFLEIIIIAVAIIGSIVSAVTKSAKKKLEQTTDHHEWEGEESIETEYPSAQLESVDSRNNKDYQVVMATREGSWSHDQEALRKYYPDQMAHLADYTTSEERHAKHDQIDKAALSTQTDHAENEPESPMFNLRDAVIYSELLKPKFED